MEHQLLICLDEEEAAGRLWSCFYQWCPGGGVFPRDVMAVVIYLPIRTGHLEQVLPHRFVVGDFRLSGNYFTPTINPSIHWDNSSGHVVNGKLLECPETHIHV